MAAEEADARSPSPRDPAPAPPPPPPQHRAAPLSRGPPSSSPETVAVAAAPTDRAPPPPPPPRRRPPRPSGRERRRSRPLTIGSRREGSLILPPGRSYSGVACVRIKPTPRESFQIEKENNRTTAVKIPDKTLQNLFLMCFTSTIDHAFERPDIGLCLKLLDSQYSEFRPVVPDGESFYRSFIFSYLEQISDKVDTHREDHLLAAVRALASQAEPLPWASLFSQRRKAFEMLIEKTKGWKRMSEYQTSRASYSRGQFLLEFFSNYDTTDDIFSFLRLVAATWMCALRVQYGRRLNLGGRPVEDWCSRAVLPPRETANWIVVRALAEAFRVAVRVEDVNSRSTQNTHYSIPQGTPIVTLLFIDGKYDIIYPINPVPQAGSQQHPHAPAAETSSGGGAGQRAQSGFWWFDCCFAVPRDIHPRAADQAKPH
ncbi:uncharacterized protein LOC107303486 isoform X2 [Oryza brachyantha]|uniref:uncharacterized protein LOC107303486 isoform X2 n=1 Tax=Oryza brachyantha TaxID=4533 RepID=UPI001ADA8EB2|nr:uncharacterized protein LOC107303486 isoform X2 [Oryza brachyantha]